MAAITSTASGNWSTTGTWTGGVVPGNGDTSTVNHAVTISGSLTVGSGPATGGTPAIAIGAGGSIVHTGGTVTVKGDIIHNADSAWTMSAGAAVVFSPASGAQYKWTFSSGFADRAAYLFCNGSSGSHCAVSTSAAAIAAGGSPAYFASDGFASHVDHGLITASYTDFARLGDSTHWGILSLFDAISGDTQHNYSVTNCTFTACSITATFGPSHTWDGNFTFTSNAFSASVKTSGSGHDSCAYFDFQGDPTTGTRLIQSCASDAATSVTARKVKILDCVLGGLYCTSPSNWPDDTYFRRVVIYYADDVDPIPALHGPIKDVFFFNKTAVNPHYVSVADAVTAGAITGCIFEHSGTTGDGDCVFPPTNTGTLSVKNCIVLPNAGGLTSGKLVSNLQTGSCAVTAEHNTFCGKGAEGGVVAMGEAASYAGEIASCRANLVWSDAASTGVYAAMDIGTPATNAVTVAGYNGFWNANTGTCFHDTSTSQSGVLGYSNLKGSTAGAIPNTQFGTGDVTGNPNFVDATRDFGSWGATQGGDGTHAGAFAILSANPALIGQAGTGLMAWIYAGFRPQSATFKGASYSGDASTADAAGNAWSGATPDIGAMAWVASAASYAPWIFGDQLGNE